MKAFAIFLQEINDGRSHSALTADLEELLRTVKSTGRSGSLTLKLKVSPATKGGGDIDKITITADRKLELPKDELASDFFWLTENAEPTRKHPRQQELELRSTTADDKPATFKSV